MSVGGGGRPISWVWKHVNTVEVRQEDNNKKKKLSHCKYCQVAFAFPNATRIKEHLAGNKCLSCPPAIKTKCQKELKPKSGLPNIFEENEDEPMDQGELQKGTQKQKTSAEESLPSTSSNRSLNSTVKINSFFDHMSPKDQAVHERNLTKAIIASGMPISATNNPYWQNFLKKLRPSFNPPSSKKIGGSLLNAEFSIAEESTDAKIKEASSLVLLSDGWTNQNNEAVLNVIVATPEPVFVTSIFPGQQKEDADFIAKVWIDTIEKYDPSKFSLIVSDRAANNVSAGKKVKEKYPHIEVIGCISHGIALILSDIIKLKTVSHINAKAKSVVKCLKNKRVNKAVFKAKQAESTAAASGNKTISLKLPNKTRVWGATSIMFKSLEVNKTFVQETAISPKVDVPKEVKDTILSDEFWSKLSQIQEIIEPLSASIKLSEGDNVRLSIVPEIFFMMMKKIVPKLDKGPLTKREAAKVTEIIEKRKKQSLLPIHYAANLLDPFYKGKNLTSEEMQQAHDFISQKAERLGLDVGDVLANLASYKTCSEHWESKGLWAAAKRCAFSSMWWGGLCSGQPITALAMQLCNSPPSSATCERNWSDWGRIDTRPRNRTDKKKALKLVKVMGYLKTQIKDANKKEARFPSSFLGERVDFDESATEDEDRMADLHNDSDITDDETETCDSSVSESGNSDPEIEEQSEGDDEN